jgi:hypothetical protein
MLDSTHKILNHYIDDLSDSRFDIHSIETERGENPEDLFYFCYAKDVLYIVYETDFIDELSYIIREVKGIFPDLHLQPLHWLVKKENREQLGVTTLSLKSPDKDRKTREALVLNAENSYLRYMVLEVTTKEFDKKRYDPMTYGYSTIRKPADPGAAQPKNPLPQA